MFYRPKKVKRFSIVFKFLDVDRLMQENKHYENKKMMRKCFLSTCIENKTRPIDLMGKDDGCHFIITAALFCDWYPGLQQNFSSDIRKKAHKKA